MKANDWFKPIADQIQPDGLNSHAETAAPGGGAARTTGVYPSPT